MNVSSSGFWYGLNGISLNIVGFNCIAHYLARGKFSIDVNLLTIAVPSTS